MLKQLTEIKIWLPLIFLCLFQGISHSAVTFKEVTVTGTGMSLEEATNNALTQAISMVNGKNVQTKTVITTMSGDEKSQEAQEIEALGEFFEALAAAAAEAEERRW